MTFVAADQPTKRWLRILDDWYVFFGHWTLTCWAFVSPLAFVPAVWLVPSLRIPALLYVAWIYYDRRTPHVGGRRFEFMRNLRFWRYRREYFPVELVRSQPLPADRTYLFAAFPHGLIVLGASTNFCSDTNGFSRLFPGLVPYVATLNVNFWWPITRDLLLAFGCCSASAESILHVLKGAAGNVCVLLVGGLAEALRSVPGQYTVVLRNRKGFVRTALRAGYVIADIGYYESALVPVFSFGEPNAYDQVRGDWYVKLQRTVKSMTGLPFVVFKGRTVLGGWPVGGFFSALPYRRPIVTVVGPPIELPKVENPSDELVDRYHELFVRELRALFDRYKDRYDDQNGCAATLVIE